MYPSVHPSIPRNQNQIKPRSLVKLKTGPHGFWGSGENGYLFSGSWGALVIIFRDLGSKLIFLGIKGALQKCKKKSHLKRKAFISFDFFFKSSASVGSPPDPQGKYKCLYFRANMLTWIGIGDLYGE